MAQSSSDIEFGKLALILGFLTKENVYNAVRETALLQEFGIPKRIAHVMYERHYLNADEIQAISWALYKTRKISRFPARVVYEFTEEDDKKFLEQAWRSVDDLLAAVRKTPGKALDAQPDNAPAEEKKTAFPQEVLIYCRDLQNQLRQKGFPRPLVSIISAKGFLQGQYRDLLPNVEEKKKIITSPEQAKSWQQVRKWEAILFNAPALQKSKLTLEQSEQALESWQKFGEDFHLPLRYSEFLYYQGLMAKSDLTKLGIFVSEIAHIEVMPRFQIFDLSEEECEFVKAFMAKEEKYQHAYDKCSQLSTKLQKIGVNIPPEKLLIHQEYISRAEILSRLKKEPEFQKAVSPEVLTAEHQKLLQKLQARGAQSGEKELSAKEKRDLTAKMLPFALDSLDKEFASSYQEERKTARIQQPEGKIKNIIEELSQTQMIGFQEINVSPTQDIMLQGEQIRPAGIVPPKISPAEPLVKTEYIALPTGSLQTGGEKGGAGAAPELKQELAQTTYIAIDASAEDIHRLNRKIAESMGGGKAIGKILWALFVIGTGIAIVEGKLRDLFPVADTMFRNICTYLGKPDAEHLPIYTAMSMLLVYLPSLFLGDWLGKIADKGRVHKLYLWGFIIFAISLTPIALTSNIIYHSLIRFVEGIGLAAALVAAEYCIGRWYGPLERGKITGVLMMVFTAGVCFGFILPDCFDGTQAMLGISTTATASIVWTFVSLATIFAVFRIRLTQVTSEDEEELVGGLESIPKKPLIAAALYGLTEAAFFAVFFPFYPDNVYLWGEVSTDLLITIFGVGVFLSSYTLGWLSDRIGPVPILIVLSLVAVASFCILPFTRDAGTAQLMFLALGIVIGGLCPLGFSWLLERIDNERYFGVASGAFAVFEGAGSMIGCLLCGIVFIIGKEWGFFMLLSLTFVGYFYLLLSSPARESSTTGRQGQLRGLLSFLDMAKS